MYAARPTLAWLRLVLALMVLDLHYGFFRLALQPWLQQQFGPLAWVNDGALAVFGFFSLSGYLVADMVLSRRFPIGTGRRVLAFVASRWARIYPLYWVVFALWAIWLWSRGPVSWLDMLLNAMLWPYGLWSFFYNQQLYGPLFNHLLLVPAWTLAMDLVLYPIGAILLLHRPAWTWFWLLLALAWWACAAWLAPLSLLYPGYVWWHFRYWTGAGSAVLAFILGLVLRRHAAALPRPAWSGWMAAIAVLWCAYLPLGLGYFASSLLATIALAWLVHVLAANGKSAREAQLSNWTYAIYLLHIPVLFWLAQFWKGTTLLLAATPLTLIFAWLLARYVEQPLERWRRTKFAPSAATSATVDDSWSLPWLIAATAIMLASTLYYILRASQWAG